MCGREASIQRMREGASRKSSQKRDGHASAAAPGLFANEHQAGQRGQCCRDDQSAQRGARGGKQIVRRDARAEGKREPEERPAPMRARRIARRARIAPLWKQAWRKRGIHWAQSYSWNRRKVSAICSLAGIEVLEKLVRSLRGKGEKFNAQRMFRRRRIIFRPAKDQVARKGFQCAVAFAEPVFNLLGDSYS